MRAAVTDLKLPSSNSLESLGYEDDEDSDYAYSSGTGGHDVWDFISDTELEQLSLDSGDLMDGTDGLDAAVPLSAEWLLAKCSEVAARRDGLPPDTLQGRILEALRSSRPEDELQSQLTDLIGFDDLNFVIELLSHRKEIISASVQSVQPRSQEPSGGRLLTKAERKEALRKQDLQHKTATLAAASTTEPNYPHVYRAYSAGNTLNHAGKRYALPAGSEKLEFEKYEEYSIPAGRTGTLGPGQKLVQISDLDGLCRRTFSGYKALNRMQSLVYPVAYKTSENMLICAPTGAVSNELLGILGRFGQ